VFTYLVMFEHRVRKRDHTTTGSCADPTCTGFTEITKAAAVRNVSNEGTAAATTDRLVPNREEGGFAGNGESGGDAVDLLDGDVRCVPICTCRWGVAIRHASL
jgi:hypothetical protein